MVGCLSRDRNVPSLSQLCKCIVSDQVSRWAELPDIASHMSIVSPSLTVINLKKR